MKIDVTLGGGELDITATAGAIGLKLGVVDNLIIDCLQGNSAARAVIAIGLQGCSRADVGGIGYSSNRSARITNCLYCPAYC